MILRDSSSSCSSAASVFSLREVQLQKDPGHRSSVFQPLGKTSSLHPGFPPLLAINCTFNSLSFIFLKLMFVFLISSRKKPKAEHFLEVGEMKRRCGARRGRAAFSHRGTKTGGSPHSHACSPSARAHTYMHAPDAGHFSAREISHLHAGDGETLRMYNLHIFAQSEASCRHPHTHTHIHASVSKSVRPEPASDPLGSLSSSTY